MKMRTPFALGICLTLLASTISFIGSPASAAPKTPKIILPSPTMFILTKVVGNRLMINPNGKELYYLDSKMKIQKVGRNTGVIGGADPSRALYFANQTFFGVYNLPEHKFPVVLSLDEKDKAKTYLLPVPKNTRCRMIAPLKDKLFVGCEAKKPSIFSSISSVFSISTDGSVNEVILPIKGEWEPMYLGLEQIMFKTIEAGDPLRHRFFAMDGNANFTHQFDITNIYGDTAKILASRENGWIIGSDTRAKGDLTWSDCGVTNQFRQIFFVDNNGTLKTFGELGSNESVYFDDQWSSNGRFYFERQLINSERCWVRKDKYEVDKFGQAIKLSSQPGEGTPRKTGLDQREDDPSQFLGFTTPDDVERWFAALKICPIISKGKAQGKTMFNGHAICRQDNKLVAYPYPEWKMPQLPTSIFPIVNQDPSTVQLEPTRRQAAGVGAPTWSAKCPEFVDVPLQVGGPKIPGLFETPQPKIMGFKFDGTGQTFTRLADGTAEPSKEPANLIGCYANLFDFDSNPKGANSWQIGSINRDSSGYYWTNAAGVRWGLTLSGKNLVTDKESPYYSNGRQFITF